MIDFESGKAFKCADYCVYARIMSRAGSKHWHEVAMNLRMAYWAMHRRTGLCLARRGVTADQFVLLALLMEEGNLNQQELVRRASSDPSTVRAMLVLLASRGLVSREADRSDRRALRVNLTAKGRRAYKGMRADTQEVRGRLLAALKAGQSKVLVKSLSGIASAMQATPESVPRQARNKNR
jgi:DNA-binding MarR family transcriptional regulator